MKVLILGVASVQLDAIIELKKMNYETFAIAKEKDGPAADVADHFAIINIIDEENVVKYIQENKIDAVYSVGSDLAIPIACKISEFLNLPRFVTSHIAYTCNHKGLMREALTSECSGNIPYQIMENDNAISIDYPLIVKPSDAQGQRGVFLINSKAEFDHHFPEVLKYSREKKVILEKYIDGQEISVNGYMVNGVLKFLISSDRVTWPEYTGLIHKHVIPGQLDHNVKQKVKEVVEDACNRIGILNGPIYFQIKITDDRPYIIEMTPRLDGCHMWKIIELAAGVNLMKLTFKHLIENDISELDNLTDNIKQMELVFWCQEPNTIIDRRKLELPDNFSEYFYYYNNGDVIRPVNGKYEKVGYFIRDIK